MTKTALELDRMYWELYGNMRKCKDWKTYREYCQIGGEIIKELERRGILTLTDLDNKIKEDKELNA